MPSRFEISDELWAEIEPLIPVRPRRARYPGRKPIDDRRVLNGILHVLHTGIAWEDLDLPTENLEPILPLAQAKEEFQTDYINRVLRLNNGNRTKTAKDLGVDPRTIFRHLEKLEPGEEELDGL